MLSDPDHYWFFDSPSCVSAVNNAGVVVMAAALVEDQAQSQVQNEPHGKKFTLFQFQFELSLSGPVIVPMPTIVPARVVQVPTPWTPAVPAREKISRKAKDAAKQQPTKRPRKSKTSKPTPGMQDHHSHIFYIVV